jgi:hypothetical protein
MAETYIYTVVILYVGAFLFGIPGGRRTDHGY